MRDRRAGREGDGLLGKGCDHLSARAPQQDDAFEAVGERLHVVHVSELVAGCARNWRQVDEDSRRSTRVLRDQLVEALGAVQSTSRPRRVSEKRKHRYFQFLSLLNIDET